MNYTFNNVDPTKKHKRKGWIDKLAPGISFKKKFFLTIKEKQTQFQKFTSKDKNYHLVNISENNLKDPLREIMKEEINKKLQNTKFTFEILEEKYSKDEHLHILYDIKGQSIWFDEKYMKTFKWSEAEYFSINCFKILGNETNQGHPLIEIFLQNFEEKPKEFVCKNF